MGGKDIIRRVALALGLILTLGAVEGGRNKPTRWPL